MSRTNSKAQGTTASVIREAIAQFVATSPLNRMPGTEEPYFDGPVVGIVSADASIFEEYKRIIHPTHLTPREALSATLGIPPDGLPKELSVVSWVLPITERTRKANRRCSRYPSKRWALTRTYGEAFNEALHDHIVEWLSARGNLAVAPTRQPYFRVEYAQDEAPGYFSVWSQRHIAYAAGLGTFGLSDGLITERGVAHRCGSVVTDLASSAREQAAESPYAHCLHFSKGSCRACVERCPAGAITEEGHDKVRCREYVYGKVMFLARRYGAKAPGCGLCQTATPCEDRNPVRRKETVNSPRSDA
jgi:epoxyqueuosine reductase QueG